MTTEPQFESLVHIGPRRLTHVNLFVSDLERSLAFYNRVCGLEIVLRQPSIGAGFLSNGNTNHDIGMITTTAEAVMGEGGHQILAAGVAARPGLYHLGWEMEHEFDLVKANERSAAHGYRINRTVRHLSTRSLYLFDADANIHEFYADVSKDWRRLYNEGKRVSGHWLPGELQPSMQRLYHEDPQIREVNDAVVNVTRFGHAGLTVRQFGRMRSFFRNIVGLLEVYANEDIGVAAFAAPSGKRPVCLTIHRAEGLEKHAYGLHHFALEIEPAVPIREVARRLEAAGNAPETVLDLPHKASVLVRDPDGLMVELVQYRDMTVDFAALATASALDYGV